MLEALQDLFNNPKKHCHVKIIVMLDSVKELNETFLISFQKDNIEFKGIFYKKRRNISESKGK